MTDRNLTNVAASVRQRLLNRARTEAVEVDDGMRLDASSVVGREVTVETACVGLRVAFDGELFGMVFRMQVDVELYSREARRSERGRRSFLCLFGGAQASRIAFQPLRRSAALRTISATSPGLTRASPVPKLSPSSAASATRSAGLFAFRSTHA